MLIPFRVFANQDFKISEEDYEKLLLFYTPEYIETMDYNEYNSFRSKNIDPEHVTKTNKFFRIVTNKVTGDIQKEEITEDEYNLAEINKPTDRDVYYEISYEKIVLTLMHLNSFSNFFSYTGIWKVLPSVRSYDNIGARTIGFNIVEGTQITKQIFKYNGNTTHIDYPYNGIHSKYFDDGYGVSVGLVGSGVTDIQVTTSASMTVDFYPATIYGAYEHAIDIITLSTAKNYTIGYGYGDVFIFGGNVGSHYDGMTGLHQDVLS